MKGYRVVKEHDTHFELSHPEDGTFRISKSQLSPGALKKVRALPQHLDEGGEANLQQPQGELAGFFDRVGNAIHSLQSPTSDQQPASPNAPVIAPIYDVGSPDGISPTPTVNGPRPDQSAPTPSVLDNLLGGTAYGAERPDYPQGNPSPSITVNPPETPSAAGGGGNPNTAPATPPKTGIQATGGMPNFGAGYTQGFNTEMGGIKNVAAAQTQGAADIAKAQNDYAVAAKTAKDAYDKSVTNLNTENDQLTSAVHNAKIDPNRVWSNASTGNKIAAGIGILLSGIGSGLTGQQNMAMGVIQKTIDRDVDAQKAELGKKENLLSMNMRKYGNANAAYQATAMQLNSIVQGQIGAAAAKMQGGVAAGQAQQAIGHLQLQRAQMGQQLAMFQLKQRLVGGDPSGQNAYLMNQLFPGQVVNVPGAGLKLAATADDAKKVKDAQESAQDLLATIQKARDFNKNVAGTIGTLPGSSNNDQANAIFNELVPKIQAFNGLTRLSETDKGIDEGMIKNPGTARTEAFNKVTDNLEQAVRDKLDALYGQRLINHDPGAAKSKVKGL